eukprot:TRINITY_DN5583_c0_g1_i1.p1 TRINITY_DN5583_c0_g1~~TRINITY_DN5583_c0_g1_i1.p1  ORF type:complete len:207 (+),score=36.35 TRINITY_DN5583_c0_g1_i1:446-1066(+)
MDAQNALRRTMETYSKVTRFCLICNYVSCIIGPITSRCAKFRFRPLDTELMEEKLLFISQEENVNIDSDNIQKLIELSNGDMRKAIMLLQSVYRLHGTSEVDEQSIIDMAGIVPGSKISNLLTSCRSRTLPQLRSAVLSIINDGYGAGQIIEQFFELILVDEFVTSQQKAMIMESIANAEKLLIQGADEYLQILCMCSDVMKILRQ